MKRSTAAGGALATVLLLLLVVFAVGYRRSNQNLAPVSTPATASSGDMQKEEVHQSFLYGRIATLDGATYEGRLRWGRNEEAFWGDYFNGAKKENAWASYVPAERLPKARRAIQILGLEVAQREDPIELGRLFMARFGDIARIEARGRDVRVTLKSGTAFDLDRFSASDFDDGVRVWDGSRGVVDLDSLRIREIELRAAPRAGSLPARLHGVVRTRHGNLTGFVQWDRQECLGSDQLDGRTATGEIALPFSTVRSIARRSADSSLVTLLDGREIEISGTREAGRDNRGLYVDDPRYGRVLVSWDAFEHVEFGNGGGGPAYDEFPPGGPLNGSVTTRDGGRLTGRLVYDLDESEVTETLDAPSDGVDYTIPFGLIGSIVLPSPAERGAPRATVTLHSGEKLLLECKGDLGAANAGMLVFAIGRQHPEYVPWTSIEQVDLARPPAMYPRLRP